MHFFFFLYRSTTSISHDTQTGKPGTLVLSGTSAGSPEFRLWCSEYLTKVAQEADNVWFQSKCLKASNDHISGICDYAIAVGRELQADGGFLPLDLFRLVLEYVPDSNTELN